METENWKIKDLSFGTIKENTVVKLRFEGLPTIKEIKKVDVACGCIKNPKYNTDTRILEVVYKSGYIPTHLSDMQRVIKSITVTYKDDTTEVLSISGTKVR